MAARVHHVDKWVGEGIISPDQAESIREYEHQVTPSGRTAVEVLGYVGAAMVASAALVMISGTWRDLSRASRLSVLAVTAVSLMIIGTISARDASVRVRRFGQVALMLAVPAIGLTVGVAADARWDTPTSIVIGSAVAWVAAFAPYLQWRSNAQHFALFFATLSVIGSAAMNPFERVPDALPGLVIGGIGVTWLVLVTLDMVTPRLIGEILGSLSTFVGSVALIIGFETGAKASLVIFVIASVGAVAAGVLRSRVVLTIVGVTGLVFYIPWLTTEFLGPTIAGPLMLLATGAFLALWAVRKR